LNVFELVYTWRGSSFRTAQTST